MNNTSEQARYYLDIQHFDPLERIARDECSYEIYSTSNKCNQFQSQNRQLLLQVIQLLSAAIIYELLRYDSKLSLAWFANLTNDTNSHRITSILYSHTHIHAHAHPRHFWCLQHPVRLSFIIQEKGCVKTCQLLDQHMKSTGQTRSFECFIIIRQQQWDIHLHIYSLCMRRIS